MHTKGLQGGPEHSSVDAVVCFAEVDKGGVKGFFNPLVLVEKVLDDEGIVRGAAAGSETRLTLCSVVVELCPPIEAAEEGEGVELRNGRANCDAAVVIEDVGLSLRLWDRGQGSDAPVSGEGAGFENEVESVGNAVSRRAGLLGRQACLMNSMQIPSRPGDFPAAHFLRVRRISSFEKGALRCSVARRLAGDGSGKESGEIRGGGLSGLKRLLK